MTVGPSEKKMLRDSLQEENHLRKRYPEKEWCLGLLAFRSLAEDWSSDSLSKCSQIATTLLTHHTSYYRYRLQQISICSRDWIFSLLIHYTQLNCKALKIAVVIGAPRQLWQLYVPHCAHDCFSEFVAVLWADVQLQFPSKQIDTRLPISSTNSVQNVDVH